MTPPFHGKRLNSSPEKDIPSFAESATGVPSTGGFIHQSARNDNWKSVDTARRKGIKKGEGRGDGCGMEFCDLNCRYARWPDETAVDGAGSCRTFQAVFCEKRKRLVHKNAPCSEKRKKPPRAAKRLDP